jgi:neutral ceramidase
MMKYLISVLMVMAISQPCISQIKKAVMMAGARSVNITPKDPVPMSGYANRDQPSKGVHDDIFARAFVFDDGKTKACIIQADLIGFSFAFADEINKEIEKKTGIPKENCMLVAVHNHGAPVTRTYGEAVTENLTNYLNDLKKKLIDVAVEAHQKRVPAILGMGKGQCNMNINRRGRHHEGGIWLGRNPDGVCDHDVDVLRIDNLIGETIGLMVNWPCHATVGGQENSLITGDWPGAAARYVDQNYKAGIPIGITAGASGDINPIYGPHNNFGEMNAIGLVLGEEIVRVTKSIQPQPVKSLSVLYREIEVPGKEKTASRMPGEKIVPGAPVKLRFSAIRIGALVMAGISGELMTSIGMNVKEQSPYRNTTIVTHCNGSSGYLCTDAAYQEGGYEPMVSNTMPGVEKIIVDNFLSLINEL